jgi:simple sugar transport system substrate-binding protein
MLRRTFLASTALAGLTPAIVRPAFAAGEEVAIVVKIGGIPWFNALEQGVLKAGKELDLNAYMIGPTDADPAQQVRAVEDLIAKKVAVIGVVPNDAAALEPVFARAQAAGIPVITHESPDQQGNTWNIEMIDSVKFGEAHMESLAKAMGGEGEYIMYVGSLTVPLHNFWADKAVAYQEANYPKMKLVADRFGVAESVDDSYRTAVDMMKAHPNLKGVLAFGSNGPIGAGRAIKDQGKIGKVSLIGPFTPGQGKDLLKDGAIIEGFIWNPMEAGVAMVAVADLLVKKQPITDGMEIQGMGKVAVDPATRNIRAHKLQAINKDTIDGLVAMGL